jgi:uncharacterized protein (DUF2235 family)
MAKRIVVCSDGTGNSAIKDRGTNVFKVFEAVDLVSHRSDPNLTPQVALYDDGVGTGNFKPFKLLGGAFGWGLSRNVRHLYRELARIYDPGDEIYMFGFSRGAFTVRTLAGFISTCGLVDPKKIEPRNVRGLSRAVSRAYKAYRKCYRPSLWRLLAQPTRSEGLEFKKKYSFSEEVRIRFIGVWDTVDAVGLPFHLADFINAVVYQFKFPDHRLSSIVDHACQALSIDDPRQTFSPQLWDEGDTDSKRITQVWFAGVHSNVGGGYPKQGLSLVALDWMLGQSEEQGLRINTAERHYFRDHANSDDKLYDPRAGLGIFYRWKLRNIAALCRKHSVKPAIHVSALERVAHGTDNYAPGNLPTDALITISAPFGDEDCELMTHRAAGLRDVLRSGGTTPVETVWPSVVIGVLAYYIYLLSATAVVLAASSLAPESLVKHPWMAVVTIGKLIWALATEPVAVVTRIGFELIHDPRLGLFLASGFGLSYLLMFLADRRMSSVFSGYWYAKQTQLRDALKQARKTAGGPEKDVSDKVAL